LLGVALGDEEFWWFQRSNNGYGQVPMPKVTKRNGVQSYPLGWIAVTTNPGDAHRLVEVLCEHRRSLHKHDHAHLLSRHTL